MGNYAISEELQRAYDEMGIKNYHLNSVTAKEFYDALDVAKKENPYGEFVTLHEETEYEGMELLLTDDKKAGVAITNENNIISVFKGKTEMKNIVMTLLPAAIDKGGDRLDNYNSPKLFELYSLYGFIPVAKVKFDPNFAPSAWDYERDGQPDIYFWIHNGNSSATVIRELGNTGALNDSIKEFDNYEEAEHYRNNFIDELKEKENADL